MKTLYEKFCYLNGYLEEKIDDPETITLIENKGFEIVNKTDSLTMCFKNITLNKSRF